MNEILTDLTSPSMAAAIEANLFEMYRLFRFWPVAELHDDLEMLWTITDLPFSLFNSVSRAQLNPDHLDSAIEAAKGRCRSRNVPLLWWVVPTTRPVDLGTHLERHGFIHDEDEPGMAVDLATLNDDQPKTDGLVIEQVKDLEMMIQFSRVFSAGFGASAAFGQAALDLFTSVGFGTESPVRHYLAFLNDVPVATSTVFFAAGVAGIYNVATISTARRLGVGAAITLDPCLAARRMGYKAAILQASAMGAPVYRRLGFKEYCKISTYEWAPESPGKSAD